jgi:Ycf66 protein N-terminus
MLAYILAVLVGMGSVGLYIAAFFFPEIHRKQDFIWSGVGCLYALTLWIYAHEMTGGILVGQTASVALIGWFAWQILKLRRQLIPVNQQTPIPTTTQLQTKLGLKRFSTVEASAAADATPTPTRNVAPGKSNPTTVQPATNTAPQTNPPPTTAHSAHTPTVVSGETSRQNRSRTVEINIPIQTQPAPPKVVPDPFVEEDDEAWIKLEVKTSPAKSPQSQPATSQPPGETVKPPESPPVTSQALEETAKPPISSTPTASTKSLPVEKHQPPATTTKTLAQNDPIDVTPIESQLDEEENWG